jgi:hypothetical protein
MRLNIVIEENGANGASDCFPMRCTKLPQASARESAPAAVSDNLRLIPTRKLPWH